MKKFFILVILTMFFMFPAIAKTSQQENDKTLEYLNIEWWKNFNDENLTNNLLVVFENNYDLKNAALKIQETEKLVKMQFASQLPTLNFSGDLNRDLRAPQQQFGSMRIPNYSQYNYYLPLTMGYEIDIWGSNRLKTKSLKEQLEITKQAERATYISLTSDFAANYFNLIKADKLLEIQKELVDVQKQITSLVLEKYNIGLSNINDVLSEEKFLSSLKEEQNKHKLIKDVLEESLKVYLSNNEEKIKRAKFEDVTLIKKVPFEFDSGIIENRPDFKQEEANIKKIGFDVQVAKREFLPKFTIIGQAGLNAYKLGNLFNSPSQFLNLGIVPTMDLFSGGRKLAFLKLKKYQYEEALNNYQKAILTGIKEVNTSTFEYKTSIENYEESKNRLNTQTKIYTLAKAKNKIGASGNIDVLFAKEAYLMSQKEEISNKINVLLSTIELYKSVGGINLNKETL